MSHVVLVGDPGGHFALLHWLRPLLGTRRVTWVGLDSADVRARVGEDTVVFGTGPTARSPSALWRNVGHAYTTLPRLHPDLVLTSGAGLGVPWIWASRARGIPTAFVEVADRQHRPSLSLRLVTPVVDHVLVQHETARSFRRDAVMLGRVLPLAGATMPRTGPVFVALGTSPFPFERLVRAAEALAAVGHEVFVQHGASRAPVGCRSVAQLTPAAFQAALASARVVVLHGGLASRIEAQALGRVPLVVARRARDGEHVDDHQVEALVGVPGAVVVEPDALVARVARWSEPVAVPPSGAGAAATFRAWLDQVCPST